MKPRNALLTVAILFLVEMSMSVDPCQSKNCPTGTFCVSATQPCEDLPCPRLAVCVAKALPVTTCPLVRCANCAAGMIHKLDAAGCQTCQCYDPCETVHCPPTQECTTSVSDGCVKAVCVPKSLCYGSGDPHYHTHDGAVIDYQGVGWFIMSSLGQLDECQHLKGFELLVEQEKRPRWPNVAFIRAIRFTLTSSATTVKIEKYGGVSVNGNPYTPPVSAPGLVSIDPLTGIIVTSIGVVVQFDGISTARIWIPLAYRGCVSGLCGNADDNKRNDYRTKNGKTVSARPRGERFWLIGNSYRVGGPRAHEQTRDAVNLECKKSMKPTYDRISHCGTLKMKHGPFADCIYNMPKEAMNAYKSCIYDVCVIFGNRRLARRSACDSLAAFAVACENNGYVSDWREVTGCLCPGDLKMSRCARDCGSRRTCSNRSVACNFRCLKKCACPRRTPYRQGDQCLSYRQCKANDLFGRRVERIM